MMWMLSTREGKYKMKKLAQNITTNKNGLAHKEVRQANCFNACFPKSGWLKNLPKWNGGWKKGNLLGIKGLNKEEK